MIILKFNASSHCSPRIAVATAVTASSGISYLVFLSIFLINFLFMGKYLFILTCPGARDLATLLPT